MKHFDMTDINSINPNQQAIELLEFNLIKQQLSNFTSLSQSHSMVLNLIPSNDTKEINRLQQETNESRLYSDRKGKLDLSMAKDIGPSIHRASIGGTLDGRELWDIFTTLSTFRNIRSLLGNDKSLPVLASMAQSLNTQEELRIQLGVSLDDGGNILDGASPTLKNLRLQESQALSKLTTYLNTVLKRLERSNVLQEQFLTERNGRMVLLVKMEMRHKVPGIVHDVSDSGVTAFVEPIRGITLGNQWKSSSLSVKREEEVILGQLSSAISEQSTEINESVQTLSLLDVAMAKGLYSKATQSTEPSFVKSNTGYLRILGARHPLLGEKVIPIDIRMESPNRILLITGPNAGGKTVALKTTGLMILMAKAGLHVPAKQCTFTNFDAVFVNIGDHQSIERSLSSFSSQLQSIKNIMENCSHRSLVLLDELGTSTDPEEGAALAKAILGYFRDKNVACIATTHYRTVAAFVESETNMVNARVTMNPTNLQPTYALEIGRPGVSYALTIANRLGLDSETLVVAESLLPEGHRHIESLLKALEHELELTQQKKVATQEALFLAEKSKVELRHQLEEFNAQKTILMGEARDELIAWAETIRKQLLRAERASGRAQPKETIHEQLDLLGLITKELKSKKPLYVNKDVEHDWVNKLKPGDYVQIRGIEQAVKIVTPPNQKGDLYVLIGSIKSKLPSYQLERKVDFKPISTTTRVSVTRSVNSREGMQLDLRGYRISDGRERLTKFIDSALLQRLTSVRIIHGSATGAMRSMVRELLDNHPSVEKFYPEQNSTTDGATMVELR
ncbi:hypothetical protein FIM04_04025 [SAR202 cluster bacterium AC-409-J13_OGT_754m]|nr:hypothetical protein [SAR202 cluster bacterium AC-409-J13_OGT_754m]